MEKIKQEQGCVDPRPLKDRIVSKIKLLIRLMKGDGTDKIDEPTDTTPATH